MRTQLPLGVSRSTLAAGLVAMLASAAWVSAQVDLTPPPVAPAATAPAVAPPPAATAPTTAPASAETVLEDLLHATPASPAAPAPSGSATAAPAAEGPALAVPAVTRLREGQYVWNRVGRLVKDEKTGQWMFAFESDGQQLQDPPMTLVPSKYLMAMEKMSESGTKSIRFKVTGEITEYHGKNHLYVKYMQAVRDMNQF